MAKEYKLPYTASEIHDKLIAVDKKADLVNGKVPLEQLPDDIGGGTNCDLTNYALKEEIPKNLSDLTPDATHRVVTDAEKAAWNAKSNFDGDYNTLTNKPTIPTIPSSLPADGGNADTLEGLSSEDFAKVSDALKGYVLRIGTSGAEGYITFVV